MAGPEQTCELLSAEWFRRRYWDYVSKYANTALYGPALRGFYLDYVDSPVLSAAVHAAGGSPLFALFRGAVSNLNAFFVILLSHPKVFPTIGDSKQQRAWFKDLSHCIWSESLETVIASIQFSRLPFAPPQGERAAMAGHLTMFAVDFLFFHEVGHWCLGHDKVPSRAPGQSFDEHTPLEISPIMNQLLEHNADSFAMNLMTVEWLQGLSGGAHPIWRNPIDALGTLVTAVCLLFILLGQERRTRAIQPIGIHPHPELLGQYPHPAMRIFSMQQSAMNFASFVSQSAAGMMWKALRTGVSVTYDICQDLKLPSDIWQVDSEVIERGFQALTMSWMPMMEELTRCSRLSSERG